MRHAHPTTAPCPAARDDHALRAPPPAPCAPTSVVLVSVLAPEVHAPRGGDGTEWAVETHGLDKRFGDNVAVNGVELLVPRGCAFGYLGPNGAGKTTLIRVLLGLTRADAGTMSLLGYPVPRDRARRSRASAPSSTSPGSTGT